MRHFAGWRDDPIFPQQVLNTAIAIDKEHWIMLRAAADVSRTAKELFARHKLQGDHRNLWKIFRSCIHQAQNYWDAAAHTRPETAGLLYYYSFMDLVKAYLLLKGISIGTGNEIDGLTTRINKWTGAQDNKNVFLTPVGARKISIFSSYYSTLFSCQPPPKLCIWKLLSYAQDIAYQYQSVTNRVGSNFVFKHRFAINQPTNNSWVLLAVNKQAPLDKYPTIWRNFTAEFEKIDLAQAETIDSLRGMFEFRSLDWLAFDFYQTKAGKETAIVNNQLPLENLKQKISTAFDSHISPVYADIKIGGFIRLPLTANGRTPANEEIAIYATMYFVSELLRYHSDYLEHILKNNHGWVLTSFVESSPLMFLRIITSRIHQFNILLSSY